MTIKLSLDQANQILININRKCGECGARMDPRSTTCLDRACRAITAFPKVIDTSYYEHYEIKKCEAHDMQIFYCIHPAANSELKDLVTFCTLCLKEMADKART